MLLLLMLLCSVALVGGMRQVGPRFPPTKGAVWPLPDHQRTESKLFIMTPSFRVLIDKRNCSILEKAVKRYQRIYIHNPIPPEYELPGEQEPSDLNSTLDELDSLKVDLRGPCEEWPYLGMDERYQLVVGKQSELVSESVWGILRGLETFAHLMYVADDYKTILVNETEISDFPNYPYRGLMVSTSENYISLQKILMIIAGMAMNKMNFFHWRLTGDYSFSFKSEKFPELSRESARHHTMVYTKDDIRRVIEYARDRGIVVVGDVPLPTHCRSIGISHIELLTTCNKNIGSLNPILNETHDFIRKLLQELQELFPGGLYIGSTNLDIVCWRDNPKILQYMKDNNLEPRDLEKRIYDTIFSVLKNDTMHIFWQDLWESNYPIPNNSLVHVYRFDGTHDALRLLKDGYRVITSNHYNKTERVERYNTFYIDPLKDLETEVKNKSQLANFTGSELMEWSKNFLEYNAISSIWPIVIGFAEAMWSKTEHMFIPGKVEDTPVWRAEEQACRMRRRGLPVPPPAGPSFCIASPLIISTNNP